MEIADARAARMSEAFRDIIALCDTVITRRPDATEEDWVQLLARIDDIAHRGLYGKSE